MDALASVPELEVHFGTLLEKRKYASFAKPDLDKTDLLPWPDVVRVWKTEEKGSDVALASHLLLDGFKGAYDAAAILSNDSDLIEPVRMVKAELGLPIGLLSPVQNPTPQLRAAASFLQHVKPSHLAKAQFPDPVSLQDGDDRNVSLRNSRARSSAYLAAHRPAAGLVLVTPVAGSTPAPPCPMSE